MAKPFYSMEEVCEMLGKTPDQIRELVGEGTLREFRDAGKVFFKAEDVNQLTGGRPAEKSDSGELVLESADQPPEAPQAADEGISPPPESPGGTSIIGLEPVDEEEDADRGEKKGDTVITASGIGVFDDDELEIDADPMAETQITTGPIDDQVALEGSGSGSGLLDLTRESDDTSLGAELLDEIYPGEEEAAEPEPEPAKPVEAEPEPVVAAAMEPMEAEEAEEPLAEPAQAVVPAAVQVGDPYEGLFSGFLVAALILLGVAGSVVGGVLQGYLPDYARLLTNNFWIFLASAGVVLVLSVVIGLFLGRAFATRKS